MSQMIVGAIDSWVKGNIQEAAQKINQQQKKIEDAKGSEKRKKEEKEMEEVISKEVNNLLSSQRNFTLLPLILLVGSVASLIIFHFSYPLVVLNTVIAMISLDLLLMARAADMPGSIFENMGMFGALKKESFAKETAKNITRGMINATVFTKSFLQKGYFNFAWEQAKKEKEEKAS